MSDIRHGITKNVLECRLAKLKALQAQHEADAAQSAHSEFGIASTTTAIHAKSGVELYTWALKGMEAASHITALEARVRELEEALTIVEEYLDDDAPGWESSKVGADQAMNAARLWRTPEALAEFKAARAALNQEWDYGKIRPATQQEIDQITVIKMEPDND